MNIGYARTSTLDQVAGLEDQQEALSKAGAEKLFIEQASAVGERPELQAALDYVREGDTLVVTKLDRLARSVGHLREITHYLEGKGVALRILDLGGSAIDTKGPMGKLMLTMVGAFAEFERDMMLDRQRAGIAKAKAEGKYKGRKPTARAMSAEVIMAVIENKELPSAAAKRLGVGRASVFRILKDYQEGLGVV